MQILSQTTPLTVPTDPRHRGSSAPQQGGCEHGAHLRPCNQRLLTSFSVRQKKSETCIQSALPRQMNVQRRQQQQQQPQLEAAREDANANVMPIPMADGLVAGDRLLEQPGCACWQWCIFDFVSYITNNKPQLQHQQQRSVNAKCDSGQQLLLAGCCPAAVIVTTEISQRSQKPTKVDFGIFIFDCDDCALKFDTFWPERPGMPGNSLLLLLPLLLYAKMLASRQGIGWNYEQQQETARQTSDRQTKQQATLIRLASAACSSNVISHKQKWADWVWCGVCL